MAEPRDIQPKSKVDVDPNFDHQLQQLKNKTKAEAENMAIGGQVRWLRPLNWNGSVFDWEGMHAPFQRDVANAQFLSAVIDTESPGTVGDVMAATTMIDYLSVMERAFRMRHAERRSRMKAHMIGRKLGHGSTTGVFVEAGLEYLRRLVQRAKGLQ